MNDERSSTAVSLREDDPLGPVATRSIVAFGAREAVLAGVTAGDGNQELSAAGWTGHITCTSVTLLTVGNYHEQTFE